MRVKARETERSRDGEGEAAKRPCFSIGLRPDKHQTEADATNQWVAKPDRTIKISGVSLMAPLAPLLVPAILVYWCYSCCYGFALILVHAWLHSVPEGQFAPSWTVANEPR